MPVAIPSSDVQSLNTNRSRDYGYLVAKPPLPRPSQERTETITRATDYFVLRHFWQVTTDPKLLVADLAANKVAIANPDGIVEYLTEHTDLPEIVGQLSREVRQALLDVPLTLALEHDRDDPGAETLILYLQPPKVDVPLFQRVRDWNIKIAEHMVHSQAWFVVNVDLRRPD